MTTVRVTRNLYSQEEIKRLKPMLNSKDDEVVSLALTIMGRDLTNTYYHHHYNKLFAVFNCLETLDESEKWLKQTGVWQ